MIALANYTKLTQLSQNNHSTVYRAYNQQNDQFHIIKLFKQTNQPHHEIQHEYELTHHYGNDAVIKAVDLGKYQEQSYIIFDDMGGTSLATLMQQTSLSLIESVRIAIYIIKTIESLHSQYIIHQQVNPHHIIINNNAQQVQLIDLSLAQEVTQHHSATARDKHTFSHIAYISPEQTGRLDKPIDYRTDFYSFGVTIYELFSGQLPFSTKDGSELIHCHIAKAPAPLIECNHSIPSGLSDVVMKLLAKTPEERYQSAFGIKADLQYCLDKLTQTGQIEKFKLAQQDIPTRLQLGCSIYGRKNEINTLLDTFRQVQNGDRCLCFVAGYAGIGKTSLINAFKQQVISKIGYFITGKFDQYQRDIPYSALVFALRDLTQQLLSESSNSLRQWKQALEQALGINGQVIVDVIPEIEHIIGPQPAIPELDHTEALNRFNLVFRNFIRVFCQPHAPLIIFLDDLQWVDKPTLNLIEVLLADIRSQGLLLIGAYRDNEIHETHSLPTTIKQLQSSHQNTHTIHLSSLSIDTIKQWLVELLVCEFNDIDSLAKLLLQKTNGNPFFIEQFLQLLYESHDLYFDHTIRQWQCHINRIQEKCASDNVVDLMIEKIQQLDLISQQLLQYAACMGNQFGEQLLANIINYPIGRIKKSLIIGMQAGLISSTTHEQNNSPTSSSQELSINVDHNKKYQFTHDRIQQAAYSMLTPSEKQNIHWKIGQLLLTQRISNPQDEYLFNIVNQLNLGITKQHNANEHLTLAQLNLQAGKKAKDSMAYEPAYKYCLHGIAQLPKNCWESAYNLSFELQIEATEAASLNRQYDEMEVLAEQALDQATSILDKIRIYETKIYAYSIQYELHKAIDAGFSAFKLLKIDVPRHPNNAHIFSANLQLKKQMRGKEIKNLAALSVMQEPEKKAIMRIIFCMWTPSYMISPKLTILLSIQGIILSIRFGNAAESSFCYINYGFMLTSMFNKIDLGYQYGKVALHLLENKKPSKIKVRSILGFNAFLRHWKEPLHDISPLLLESYQDALDMGDLEFAELALNIYANYTFLCGQPLSIIKHEMIKHSDFIRNLNNTGASKRYEFGWLVANCLTESTNNTPKLIEQAYINNQLALPQQIDKPEALIVLCYYNFYKAYHNYMFENYKTASFHFNLVDQYVEGTMGHINHEEFYTALSRLAVYSNSTKQQRKIILKKVKSSLKIIKRWTNYSPMNFKHFYCLIKADRYRVLDNQKQAIVYYDRAIQLSQQYQYINIQALACELAAKFYLSINNISNAKLLMQQATQCYQQWGASSKSAHLQHQYPQLFQTNLLKTDRDNIQLQQSTHSLDVTHVLKATQVITSEINFDSVLEKLMALIIENAGAQKAYLMLLEKNTLIIKSQITLEEKTPISVSLPINQCNAVPHTVIQYVYNTQDTVIVNNYTLENRFLQDEYLKNVLPKAFLCLPILNQNKLVAILYLENKLVTDIFTDNRLEALNVLASQAAISITNALLWQAKEHAQAEALQQREVAIQSQAEALKQRELAIESLQKTDKIKDEFIANTSHELRTPLNGIIGITNSLMQGVSGELPDNAHENLKLIYNSGKRLANLVNDILDISKLKHQELHLHCQPIDLYQLINITLTLCKPLIKSKENSLKLQSTVSTHCDWVYADGDRLQQILYNLIGNAIKFTDHGDIIISSYRLENNMIAISISDTGLGVPQNKLAHIFHYFEQADSSASRSRGGSGLGLAITQKLVELHGGTIKVSSKINHGTTFTFTLPISTKREKIDIQAPLQACNSNSKTLRDIVPIQTKQLESLNHYQLTHDYSQYRILIVDDEPINLQVISNYLSFSGYQLETCQSGEEALQHINSNRPDCILLDVMLPQMDGFQLCQRIRQNYSLDELPIIFLTAKNQITDLNQGFSVGGNDYLTKPFSQDELLARTRTQLALLTSRQRLTALKQFSNQIAEFKDIDKLLQVTVDFLNQDKKIKLAVLLQDNKYVYPIQNTENLIEQAINHFQQTRSLLQSSQKKGQFIEFNYENSNYMILTLEKVQSWTILLKANEVLSPLDRIYIENILTQAQIIRDNLQTITMDTKLLSNLGYILCNIENITYIKSALQYVEIYQTNNTKNKLLLLSLKHIQLHMGDILLQCHRSYLVNPYKVLNIRKKTKDSYELVLSNQQIPVGKNFLPIIKQQYPHWFIQNKALAIN